MGGLGTREESEEEGGLLSRRTLSFLSLSVSRPLPLSPAASECACAAATESL